MEEQRQGGAGHEQHIEGVAAIPLKIKTRSTNDYKCNFTNRLDLA